MVNTIPFRITMKLKRVLFFVAILLFFDTNCQAQTDKETILKVVNEFFDTMEKKDSTAFNNLFLENAHAYSVRKMGDSTITRSSILKAIATKDKLAEKLREEDITIHFKGKVAAVWAPYDFWINGKHSHCGYEVFTLIKNQKGWKIASLTYSVEKDTCKE